MVTGDGGGFGRDLSRMTLTPWRVADSMEAKKRLAVEVASAFHDQETVLQARREWEQIHQKKAATSEIVVPADTPTIHVSSDLMHDGQVVVLKLIVHCGFAKTNSEVRRLIDNNGIRLKRKFDTDGLK
jgi:tyrosyl-tRNA synthetase